jgi:hypothetical protein
VGDVVEYHQPAVPHAVGDLPQRVDRSGPVVRSGHREHRDGDLAEPFSHVEGAESLAGGGVAVGVGLAQGFDEALAHRSRRGVDPDFERGETEFNRYGGDP